MYFGDFFVCFQSFLVCLLARAVSTNLRVFLQGKPVRTRSSRFGLDPCSVLRVARAHFFLFGRGVDKTISQVFVLKRYFVSRYPPLFENVVVFLLIYFEGNTYLFENGTT